MIEMNVQDSLLLDKKIQICWRSVVFLMHTHVCIHIHIYTYLHTYIFIRHTVFHGYQQMQNKCNYFVVYSACQSHGDLQIFSC